MPTLTWPRVLTSTPANPLVTPLMRSIRKERPIWWIIRRILFIPRLSNFGESHFKVQRREVYFYHLLLWRLNQIHIPDYASALCRALVMYAPFCRTTVLILDGNSELRAHVRSNICYLICIRNINRSKAVAYRIFFYRKSQFLLMRAQHDMSYYLI